MFANTRLRTVVTGSLLAVGIIPAVVIGVLAQHSGGNELKQKAYNQLVSMRDVKKRQVETYFHERQGDIGVLVDTVGTLRMEAFNKLVAVREIKKAQINGYFRDRLSLLEDVQKNLRFTGGALAFAEAFAQGLNSEAYKEVERKRFDALKMFCDIFGFYDIFLIDANGNVVFTVAKESDLGENLVSGPLKTSGLAKAFA